MEGDGIALMEVKLRDRVVRGEGCRDEQDAFGEIVPGNPNHTAEAAWWARAAPPL